ncbi:MAG: methylenetetrahydrofolate--tRNA-(uracil(54)-C(5))-methyltransferase (FADH(2)-oxidizing) TrmFO [Deltaproteobacteria bacterium 13_1_20CM_2_69_21]|nr:MAG: methylenetetrahydrofolate--tRNA-(uracil(54)-C(5))-methyltransferase (FADH(2)-oxidizing) TrmFO [Deltaproteobacteria bacterium 13_1_40CM_4_68_19]OLD10856.1 MAG: methylenetetrahydrofolate--tRNA-(uracil(54)-C(5))-methyltransferase (FADH(2)-oxidizing) TrmFO [Deltaproteobacteria bacterium 13_1_40CM_3_69_14]OLD45999.1 MAG: methylenetetrahydrofolate--tRNA-(uracil(54)-C(5))-methyltransferase (FADH(2)-oxidizing) TrmFO [Chloroflexi bacterium 13_1_40CM_2_68_14]OLE63091.1 MAG: methylenetetrahydrofola
MQHPVHIVGGGLAGTEAALLLADAGADVVLHEQKPERRSPAHKEDGLAELVCSNSLRSDNPHNAIGLLHEELRRLGSPVLAQADRARVPAGDALAVDRVAFSGGLTAQVRAHPRIRLSSEEVRELPAGPEPCIVATGPLTSEALARSLAQAVGASQLAFYDAIAPIVAGDSVDSDVAFAQSRYGKGEGADYLNLPLTREEYEAFVDELLRGEKVAPHEFEQTRYFEGCLPIEVMAERGRDTLAYGPMKPVGLTDPRTGRRPHAVVQLRREDKAGTAWNLVGFQTRLTWPEQKRIFSSRIPGLAKAEWVRLGQVHRNTFLNAPRVIAPDGSLKALPHVYCAGQITGVEGYVESAASGHVAARRVLARLRGTEFVPPPGTTAIGALLRHVSGEAHPDDYEYQPTNVVYALFPPLGERHKKHERKPRMLARARRDLTAWAVEQRMPLGPEPATRSSNELRP